MVSLIGTWMQIDLMLFTALITFFGFSNNTILPSFASLTLHGDAGLFGLLMGASGVGALFSVLFLVPLGQRVRRPGALLAGAIAFVGVMIVLFSMTTHKGIVLATYFLTGVPLPLVLTTNNGLLQVLAPGHMRARLLTLYLLFSFGLQPIANLWVGWLGEQIGAPLTIRTNGLAMLAIALVMLARPALRAWEPLVGQSPSPAKL